MNTNQQDKPLKTKIESPLEQGKASTNDISETRRDFIKKYGALAAVTPVALTLTMQTNKALASSCTECGP